MKNPSDRKRQKKKKEGSETRSAESLSMSPNHYRAEFFENSEMLISLYDKNLNLLDANTAFLKGLRFEKKDVLGKNISVISPDCKSSGRYKIYENIIKTGVPFVSDQVRLHPSLGSMYIRLSAFKVGDGLGISSKEITDLMETIEELETFIYKTSHDIRSPIASSLGLINLAMTELKEDGRARGYFELLKKQVLQLDEVVLRLVETTEIRQIKKTLQRIDFSRLLTEVITMHSDMEGFNSIRFSRHIAVKKPFYSDKSLLATIFQNLVHNAIKYRQPQAENSFLHLSVRDNDDGVIVVVEDNGIGISEEAQKDVFKMFFRGTTLATGSGLGLYTVKHCVKKLGGHIALQSRLNQGSSFTLYLPNTNKD